jgi:hypothetical protein
MMNVLVVQDQRPAGEVGELCPGVHQPHRDRGLHREMRDDPVLGQETKLGDPQGGVVLLWRLRTDLADGTDVRALLFVGGHCPTERERKIEPEVVRVDRRGLCAPDRERGVASSRSGAAGAGPPDTQEKKHQTEAQDSVPRRTHVGSRVEP